MEQLQSSHRWQERELPLKHDSVDSKSKSEQENRRSQVQLRNTKFANKTEEFFVTRNAVFRIFSDASNLESATATAVRALVQLFLSSSFYDFTQCFIDCFILIFEKIDSKTDKKVQNKFQNLVSQLFKKLFIDRVSDQQQMIKTINFMKDFLLLCLQAAGCERSNVRIYGARISFILTSLIPGEAVSKILAKDVLRQYLISVQRLLLLQAPVYKQLGIKLASMVQPLFSQTVKKTYFEERATIQNKTRMETIQKLLFRIVEAENLDNENTRKLVITNILVSKDNLSRMLKRLRDKSNQIKVIVIKKLVTQGYTIDTNYQRFNLAQIYKILYDGLNNKTTKKDAVTFFSQYFKTWAQEQLDKKSKKEAVQNRQVQQKQNDRKKESFLTMNMDAQQKQPENPRKKNYFQQNNQEYVLGQSRQEFLLFYHFVELFQPKLLLLNPHLYEKFDELIKQLLIQLPSSVTADYIKFLCQRFKFVAKNPDSISTVDLKQVSSQMIWLKNAMQTSNKQITMAFEKHRPYGKDLAMMLALMFLNEEIFGAYQLLQYFEKQTLNIPDQIGRREMFKGLQHCLKQIRYFQPIYGQCEANQENDPERPLTIKDFKKEEKFGFVSNQPYAKSEKQLCSVPTYEELKKLKQLSTYYHSPFISSSYDLIYYITNAIKVLNPTDYQITMLQILSVWMKTKISLEDWQDIGQDVTLDKMNIPLQMQKKHLLERLDIFQLGDLQSEITQKKIAETKRQLKKVNFDIEKRQEKSKYLLLTLSRLNPQFSFQSYMSEQSIIGHYLKKYDQADGLALLGHHCLKRLDHSRGFLTMFWGHLEDIKLEQENGKNKDSFMKMRSKDKEVKRMLVCLSLRILTDLIVKFNILIGDLRIYKEDDQLEEQESTKKQLKNQEKQKKHVPFDQENEGRDQQKSQQQKQSDKDENQQEQSPKPAPRREQLFNAKMFMQKIFQLVMYEDADIKNMAIQSLCRLLYHQKIPPKYFNTSLFYVLLLWCTCQHQTVPKAQNSSPSKDRMIYTLSMFVQCYTDPQTGKKQNLLKLAECFCVFFKIMSQRNQQGKEICRKKIKYEFQMEELMKHSIFTAVGMLRIKKIRQRNKAFATFGTNNNLKNFYEFSGPFKPEELFILYLLSEKGFQTIVDRATQITDFYSQAQCSLENLILVKEKVQEYLQEAPQKLPSKKGYGSIIQNMEKFEQTLKQKIKETGKQTFNERQIDSLRMNLERFLSFIQNQVSKIEEQMERTGVFSNKQIDLDRLAEQFELRERQNRKPTVRKSNNATSKKLEVTQVQQGVDKNPVQTNNYQGLIIKPNKSRSKKKTDGVVNENKPWKSRAKNRQQLNALNDEKQKQFLQNGQLNDNNQNQGQSMQARQKRRRELGSNEQVPNLDEIQKQRRAKIRSKGKSVQKRVRSKKTLAERQMQRAKNQNQNENDNDNSTNKQVQDDNKQATSKRKKNQRSFLLNRKFKRAYQSDSNSPQMQQIEDPDQAEVQNRERSRNKKSKKEKWKSLFGYRSDTSQPQIPSSQPEKKSNEQSESYYQTRNQNVETVERQEEDQSKQKPSNPTVQAKDKKQKQGQLQDKQAQLQQVVREQTIKSKSKRKRREKMPEQQQEEFLLPVPKNRLKRNNVQSSQDDKDSNEKPEQGQQPQSNNELNNEKSNSQEKQQMDPQQKQRLRLANQKKFLSVKSRSKKIKPDRAISKEKAELLQYLTGGEPKKPKNRKRKPVVEQQEQHEQGQPKGQEASQNEKQDASQKDKDKQKKPIERRRPYVHRQILALQSFTEQNRFVQREQQLDVDEVNRKVNQMLEQSDKKLENEKQINQQNEEYAKDYGQQKIENSNPEKKNVSKQKGIDPRLNKIRKNRFLDQSGSQQYQPIVQRGVNNLVDVPRKYNIREPQKKSKQSKEKQQQTVPKLKCEKQKLQQKKKQNSSKIKSVTSKNASEKGSQNDEQPDQKGIGAYVEEKASSQEINNQQEKSKQVAQRTVKQAKEKSAKKSSKNPRQAEKQRVKDNRPSVVDFMTPQQIKELERQKLKARIPKFLQRKSDQSDFEPTQSRRKSKKNAEQQAHNARPKRQKARQDSKQSKGKSKSLSRQKAENNEKNASLKKPSQQNVKPKLDQKSKDLKEKRDQKPKIVQKDVQARELKQQQADQYGQVSQDKLDKGQIQKKQTIPKSNMQTIPKSKMPQKQSKKIKKETVKDNRKKDQDEQLSQEDKDSKRIKRATKQHKKSLKTVGLKGKQVEKQENSAEMQEQDKSLSSQQKVGFSFVHHQANRKTAVHKESSDNSGQHNLRRETKKKVQNYAKFEKKTD